MGGEKARVERVGLGRESGSERVGVGEWGERKCGSERVEMRTSEKREWERETRVRECVEVREREMKKEREWNWEREKVVVRMSGSEREWE